MLDRNHILYIVFSTLFLITSLLLANKYVKIQKYKDRLLKIASILTVLLHYSVLYVDYFSTGSAQVSNTMLMAVYPCNVIMWLMVIVAFMNNRQSKLYIALSEMSFYIGITGGIVGVLLNEVYISNPNLNDWDVLNGLLSHTVMTFSCIYLLVGNYIKIRTRNVKSVFYGLLLLLGDGVLVIGVHKIFGLDSPNSMYLLEKPFSSLPWLNTISIGIIALLLVYVITSIYEHVKFKCIQERQEDHI